MFTTGSKLFLGIGALALVAALVYGIGSEFAVAGTVLLLSAGLGALFMGFVMLALRDADPVAQARVVGVSDAEAMGMGGTPLASSPWPLMSGLALALTTVGLVVDRRIFVAGILALVAVAVEWMVQAWADRASADPAYNRQVRDQIMQPLEFPVVAILIALAVVWAFSRVMLAVSADIGWVIFTGVAVLILLTAIVLATKPRIGPAFLAVVAVVGILAVVIAGVVGAVVGERVFHHHEGSRGVQTVDNKSGASARITLDKDTLDTRELIIPKALFTTITFVNNSTRPEALVIELGPDANGDMQTITSAEREGPSEQAMTFRILRPGTYRYYLEGAEDTFGTILVPGVVAPTPTTTQA